MKKERNVIMDSSTISKRNTEGLPSPNQIKRNITDTSKDVLIAAIKKRIKELKKEKRIF
jgi:hypothetical protein